MDKGVLTESEEEIIQVELCNSSEENAVYLEEQHARYGKPEMTPPTKRKKRKNPVDSLLEEAARFINNE